MTAGYGDYVAKKSNYSANICELDWVVKDPEITSGKLIEKGSQGVEYFIPDA